MNTVTVLRTPSLNAGLQHALLRLRAGASPWPSWKFDESDRGLQISVGADPHCDWQISSAGVEEQELEIIFTGRALLVRSARPHEGARLDGQRLGEGWTALKDGARLDFGLAAIDVTLVFAQNTQDAAWVPPRARPTLQQAGFSKLESSVRDRAALLDDFERATQQEREANPPSEETSFAPDEAERQAREQTVPEQRGPHLFDEVLEPQPVLVRYTAYTALLAVAYVVWVMLLDSV